jgi:hypothetical protein
MTLYGRNMLWSDMYAITNGLTIFFVVISGNIFKCVTVCIDGD